MVSEPSFLGNSAFMEPWCYNQIHSPPYLVPNYLHPHQYIPPPTPPPLFHYVQPPPHLYTPPFTLTYHTILSTGQPFYAVETITSMTSTAATSDVGTVVADSQLMVAHQVFDESPATPTSNSDVAGDTSHRITNKIPEIIEKVGEGFADTSRLIKEMPSNKVTLPSIIPTSASIVSIVDNLEDSGVDVIIANELDDGVGRSSVIGEVEIEMTVEDVGGQLVLNWVPVHGANVGFKGSGDDSSDGERFRRKRVSEVWGMLKDRDEEEGVSKKKGEVDDVENNDIDDDTSLFGYAMKVFDESPEPQLDIAAPWMFVESPEKVSSVKAAIPASQDTNSVFVFVEANKKAVKVNSPQQLLNNDKVMIYKLHENEYGKVLEENRKSNIDVDNRSVDDLYNLDTSKVNSQLESFSEGPRLAVSYFFNVKEHGCRHSYCTYLAIVKILCYKGMVRMLRTVLSEIVELSDSDCFDFEVSKLFDELSEEFKDEKQELLIHVVDVLVKVYVNLGKFDEAFDSIFRTKRRGYIPSILISNYLMNRLVECCKVSVKIFCLDRDGRNMVIVIGAAEYIFKMSLLRKKYEHVMSMIGNSQLCGQAMISYLLQKGFSKVALHFVKDERTRFSLALESGNIQTAVAATKEIDEKDHLYRLRVEALRQGNAGIVEYTYQGTKNFERLSFLYLITENIEKLSKMLKIVEVKNGVMGQFHNALYLGDVQERWDSNITVHLLPATKAIDGIIMMEVLQNLPSFDPHVAAIKDGYCKEGCSTIADSEILLLAGPTTVVTMINHAIGVAGVVSQECKAVVDQYGQKIMVMLLTEAPPEKICSQISLCTFDGTHGASVSIERVLEEISGMSSWHHDDMCSTCELTVAWMQNQMRQNPTQDRILSDVNELCDWLHRLMGESSVDRSKISTMPSVAFTIGDKIFKLPVKQYILKVGVLLIDTWDIKDLVALWSLGTEFKHTRNLSQQKEQPKTFIFEPILQRSDGCKPGGSFVQPSQFMVPFVTRMASDWYFSAMTLIFDPGGYDCYKIFKCYILEDKDDLKKWELLRTGPLD